MCHQCKHEEQFFVDIFGLHGLITIMTCKLCTRQIPRPQQWFQTPGSLTNTHTNMFIYKQTKTHKHNYKVKNIQWGTIDSVYHKQNQSKAVICSISFTHREAASVTRSFQMLSEKTDSKHLKVMYKIGCHKHTTPNLSHRPTPAKAS